MKKSPSALQSDSILIIAAEASSCMYAKNFMRAWLEIHPDTRFYGVGDKEMASMDMDCLGYAEDMAVMGLLEVAKHWTEISQCFHKIIEETDKRQPKFALLLDYPGFNLRLAKKLKFMKVPVSYYISPQLWAWKKGRVKQVRQYVDDMLVVFPFEVDFYKKHDIEAHFVGHPLGEVVDKESEALQLNVDKPAIPVLGLMPGSRKSEIASNLRTQLATAKLLTENNSISVKLLLAPTLKQEDLQEEVDRSGLQVEFLKDNPTTMIQSCDLILSASGTATLQVALCEKPMVVMYRMNPITAFFAKLLVRSVESFCIVNLIAGRKIVPEFFQGDANPENLASHLSDLLNNPQVKQDMLNELRKVKHKLGDGNATSNLVTYLHKKYGEQ